MYFMSITLNKISLLYLYKIIRCYFIKVLHHSKSRPVVLACTTATNFTYPEHIHAQFSNSQMIAMIKIGIFMALTVTVNCIRCLTKLCFYPTNIRFLVSLIVFHVDFPFNCLIYQLNTCIIQ